MADGQRRLEAVVHGDVQGVGFRFHAARAAARHGVVGWVANEPGRTVRAVGEGAQAALEAWLADLRVGPSGASVRQVEESWAWATGEFHDFEVRAGWHAGD